MSLLPSLVLLMLLLASRVSPWRKFAKRKISSTRSDTRLHANSFFLSSAWNNSIRMFGLGEESP
jgi:hypothetical protein